MMKNKFLRLLRKQNWMILVIALGMAACIGDPVEPVPVGYVSIYNASPYDGSSLDIYLNENKINQSAFEYAKYSGYLNFNEGSNILKFTKSGATAKIAEQALTVEASKAYSVFVLNDGTQFSTLQLNDISPQALVDKSRLRFVNLSPDSPEIDIIVTGATTTTPLFGGKTYQSYSDYREIDSGTYSFDIIKKADGTVLLTVPNIVLGSAKYYTLVAQGFSGTLPTGNNNKLTLKLLGN